MLLDRDIEFYTSGAFPDLDPVYRGHDGIRRLWQQLHEPWDHLRMDRVREERAGDCLAIEFRFRAIGRDSRAETDQTFSNANLVRNGLMVRIVSYRSFEDAVAAVRAWDVSELEICRLTEP